MHRRLGLRLLSLLLLAPVSLLAPAAPLPSAAPVAAHAATSSIAGPIDVATARATQDGSTATIRGYVVGQPTSSTTVVTGGFPNDYALALADTAGTTNTGQMLYVQIPSAFRSTWGLKSNPGLMGRRIDVTGTLAAYFGNYADSNSWEPRSAVKGDVARMIFYMSVRYEGDDGFPDLEVNDIAGNGSAPRHGRLSVLLQWNTADPPDAFELRRNDVIFETYQHNRNPFVDHPEWADAIW